MKLHKIAYIDNALICRLDNGDLVFYQKTSAHSWEQVAPYKLQLAFMMPDARPLVLVSDSWLDSDSPSVILKRLKRGIYQQKHL